MPQIFFSLNDDLRDLLFHMREPIPPNKQIVIVDIDEKSLNQLGQWPWSRSVVAKILENLTDAHAGIIGLDIVFAEEDKSSPHTIASKLNLPLEHLENYDTTLAQAFETTPTVGGYIFTFKKSIKNISPYIPAVFLEKGLQNNTSLLSPQGAILNIPLLQDALYSSGFFNNIPDIDGVIRKIPLIMRYDGMIFPSLVLEMVRIYSGIEIVQVQGDEFGVQEIDFGAFTIPTDHVGRMVINFPKRQNHFRYISAVDIFNNDFDPKEITQKFIFMGTSAIGLSDLRSTPLDSAIAGVEVHATALENILEQTYLYEPADIIVYDLLILSAVIIGLMVIFSFFDFWMLLPMVVILLYGFYKVAFYLLFEWGALINLLFPLFAFILTLLVSISIDYIIEANQRERIKSIFARKVSKSVMDDLINKENQDVLRAREEEVAIFFSDIRGFTQISEKIGSSQKLIALLNRYMTPITQEIAKYEGTVDKFIGDSVMAYWNAPKAIKDYNDKAVKSALSQIELLQTLNETLYQEFGVRLEIGIGLHTGVVTVGEMGSTGRSDYTIIGDNVNLASRLEGLNKLYGTHIIISATIKAYLKESYPLRTLDIVKVKGKEQAIEIFELYLPSQYHPKELQLYSRAITHYKDAKVQEAYNDFLSLQKQYPHTLYQLYITRCEQYLSHPTKAFDVISTMLHK